LLMIMLKSGNRNAISWSHFFENILLLSALAGIVLPVEC
jgi:hypothetical protein